MATDTAFVTLISERFGKSLDMEAIVRLVESGGLALDVELRRTCESLAIAIAAAINLFNPATLLVHGRLFDIQDGLFELTCELVRRRALAPSHQDCRIRRARCSKLQGAVATAVYPSLTLWGPRWIDQKINLMSPVQSSSNVPK